MSARRWIRRLRAARTFAAAFLCTAALIALAALPIPEAFL